MTGTLEGWYICGQSVEPAFAAAPSIPTRVKTLGMVVTMFDALYVVVIIGAFALGWISNPAQRKLNAIRRYKDSL